MKKILAALAVAMTVLTACEKNALEAESAVTNLETSDPQQAVLAFSSYTTEAMTRGGLPGGTDSGTTATAAIRA